MDWTKLKVFVDDNLNEALLKKKKKNAGKEKILDSSMFFFLSCPLAVSE